MAKAKSTPIKKVAKKSIANEAKEAYLKKHTKEQMYAEYDGLHRLYSDVNIRLQDAMYKKQYADDRTTLEISKVNAWREKHNDLMLVNDTLEDELHEAKRENLVLYITTIISTTLLITLAVYQYV